MTQLKAFSVKRLVLMFFALCVLLSAPGVASGNSIPIVSGFQLSSGNIDPTLGGISQVGFEFLVTDFDGFGDIASVNYSLVSPTGLPNPIGPISELTTVIDPNTLRYALTFVMNFYDEPGVYSVQTEVTDSSSATDTGSDNFSYGALLGVGILESNIGFGTLLPGATSSPTTITIQNVGNVTLDILISGSDLADGQGNSIPVSNLEYGSAIGGYTPVSSTPAIKNLDLGPGANALESMDLRLAIPTGTAGGVYQGNVSFIAIDAALV